MEPQHFGKLTNDNENVGFDFESESQLKQKVGFHLSLKGFLITTIFIIS